MLVRYVMQKVMLPLLLLFVALMVVLYIYYPEPEPFDATDQLDERAAALVNTLPDFKQYKSVRKKKAAFFAFMLPMIELENDRIMRRRARILELQASLQQGNKLVASDKKWLLKWAKKYNVESKGYQPLKIIEQLLIRVDKIPPSLALAQSANESAWGTSRFALQGNNLYGQWCFSVGCGIVPTGRPEGETYEVASFASPMDSVVSYMHNLNAYSAYIELREIRADLRAKNAPLSGSVLAEGLLSYSTRGEEYIKELRQMIRINRLSQYDQPKVEAALNP
ncbi:glucosaminidase domain-containing protein [Dasania sp. GY-MA-18]|uniref:Glucosaminidase domain-containing protein n=1 Tax=Dasania phycosphaerae TaxID=2950436 RepID=A0A9J6RRY9_9GAMM|nr:MULTISPECIES: glucosaminidase domain-containing protein [Dasania]MCR8924192.1 glucosaminidase domain-containing protein [Dasania sp. GY-MA-18]MCZ0866845.1 glucosaminidase domain-containing protein [Dasania phycosphaerae]MCZ0870350.1 glucosaminidase domain-containing protein [Dasania phycosphaerae]